VASGEDIADLFEVPPIDIGPPRWNLAPSQPILTIRPAGDTAANAEDQDRSRGIAFARELVPVRWGLIPWWAKADEAKKIASRCIQARAETARRAPAFRDAFRRHRCLVIVDGFFEWKTLPDGRRIPHHLRKRGSEPFAIAGLWDSWRDRSHTEASQANDPTVQTRPQEVRVESGAVLTTRAGGATRDLHDRMPLVLAASEWRQWLFGSVEEAALLLAPDQEILDQRAEELVIIPVSTWVNDVRHDDPRCIEPAAPRTQLGFSFGSSPEPPGTNAGASPRRARR
jgi:putative SOS response-associated peptidase YedK